MSSLSRLVQVVGNVAQQLVVSMLASDFLNDAFEQALFESNPHAIVEDEGMHEASDRLHREAMEIGVRFTDLGLSGKPLLETLVEPMQLAKLQVAIWPRRGTGAVGLLQARAVAR
jgi:hypothetical protein